MNNDKGSSCASDRYTYKGFSIMLGLYGNKWNFATEGSWVPTTFDDRESAKMAAEESIDYDLENGDL